MSQQVKIGRPEGACAKDDAAISGDAVAPSYAVRPGVSFPDWAAVTTPIARNALLAISEALDVKKMWHDYAPAEDRVRTALLTMYAEQACAPNIADLAVRIGLSVAAIRPLLARLKERDLVVLDPNGERVVGAYPLTDRETGHRVKLGTRILNAMCAIDALGVGAMYGRDAEVRSSCRSCGALIRIATRDRGRTIKNVEPATAVVWSGIHYERGCAADSLCKIIAFFCGDAHLEVWRAAHDPGTPGFRLSIDEALQVGRAIFAPSLVGLEVSEARNGTV
jgi:mercuric reductase